MGRIVSETSPSQAKITCPTFAHFAHSHLLFNSKNELLESLKSDRGPFWFMRPHLILSKPGGCCCR